jgi:hypothetical protein
MAAGHGEARDVQSRESAAAELERNPALGTNAFTDQQALEWLQAMPLIAETDAQLAEAWGWNEAKVKRQLKAWTSQGHLQRALSSSGKWRFSTDPSEPLMADESAPQASHASVPGTVMPVLAAEPAIASPSPEVVELVRQDNVKPHATSQRITAYLTALALASAAAYFSIGGLVELFPAQEMPVAILGAILEVAKLVMCGWLTANWQMVGWRLRVVMVVLVVGLVTVNAGGTFARLIQSHFSINDATATGVDERLGVLDARIAEQARRVADVEKQDREIADVISKMTATGQTKTALTSIAGQQARRDTIQKARQEAADKLVDLKGERSHLEAEGKRVFAETGSARFLAAQLGTDAETVIRWLVMCLVLLIDPTAIVLTIAATMKHETKKV